MTHDQAIVITGVRLNSGQRRSENAWVISRGYLHSDQPT
jgi:hypothetical protein